MKKLFYSFCLAALLVFAGCSEAYDDSEIVGRLDELEQEQDAMQAQIDAQQALLNALTNKLTITNISEVEDGYIITFSDDITITIKDGEKGEKGDTGDSFFQTVTWDEEYVYFTLADGSVIKIAITPQIKKTNVTAIDIAGFCESQGDGLYLYTVVLSDSEFLVDFTEELQQDGIPVANNSQCYRLSLCSSMFNSQDSTILPYGTYEYQYDKLAVNTWGLGVCCAIFVNEEGEQLESSLVAGTIVVGEDKIEATLTLGNGDIHYVMYNGTLELRFWDEEIAEPNYTFPYLSVTQSGKEITDLTFDAEGGDQTITITATRGWSISKTGNWFSISPLSATNESMEEKTTEVKITVAPNDGCPRSETIKVVMDKIEKNIVVSQAGEGQTALGAEIFGDNFDNGTAQDNSGWPVLDGFVNPVGDAAEGVTYTVANVQARSNSLSNNIYSGYKDEASGNNNASFRTNGVLTINNINLSAQTSKAYTLTFGCYRSVYGDADNSFKSSEFHVLLSADGEKWTEVAYTRPADEVSNYGTWNKATATFSLKEKPETLSIRFVSDLASSHRMDDVKFFVGGGGVEIDLSKGVEISNGGTSDFGSDAAFVCSADNSTNAAYTLGETKVNGASATGFKLGKSKQHGKFASQAIGVSGDKYLNFYAVSWGAGGDQTIYFRVNGGEVKSQAIKANAGANNNPPFTITVTNADHYSVLLSGLSATDTIEFSTNEAFDCKNTDPDYATRAIFFGVKLTDEPLGAEGGDNGEGGKE